MNTAKFNSIVENTNDFLGDIIKMLVNKSGDYLDEVYLNEIASFNDNFPKLYSVVMKLYEAKLNTLAMELLVGIVEAKIWILEGIEAYPGDRTLKLSDPRASIDEYDLDKKVVFILDLFDRIKKLRISGLLADETKVVDIAQGCFYFENEDDGIDADEVRELSVNFDKKKLGIYYDAVQNDGSCQYHIKLDEDDNIYLEVQKVDAVDKSLSQYNELGVDVFNTILMQLVDQVVHKGKYLD